MNSSDMVMVGSYDYRLVALSVLISVLGAYSARELYERVSDTRDRGWLAWLVGGAAADGIGTWSMHYTGMMSFSLPVPVLYDWPTVLLSLLVSVVGSAAALLVLSRSRVGWPFALAASVLLGGVGISGLHYTSMAAMRFRGMHRYSPALVILSVVLAIVISLTGLSLTFLFRDNAPARGFRKHGGALLRGAANPVMHYTAMAATTFVYSAAAPDMSRAVNISSLGVAGISAVPVVLLFVVLLTSSVDRVRRQRALLNELFEQAPEAVALMSVGNRVIRTNRKFTKVFGYAPREATGRILDDLIVPDELRDESQVYTETVADGQRVDVEGVRRRKDGSRFHVSIVGVPVSLPGGHAAVYAIYRDITERKRAEEALRQAQARIESVLSSVADIHVLFDRDWRYLYINEAAVRSMGRPREQIIGRTLWEIFPDIVGTELDRQYHRAMDERLFVNFDFHYLTSDTWWENRFYPAPEGLSVFATNITERKLAEEKLRETTEQVRALSASFQSAREEEGIRIAREIHDELGSALTGLRWELESLDKAVSESGEGSQLGALREKIETMIALTDTTVAAVRRISSELRPSILDDLGLAEAIEWQAQQFQARTGIICRCNCTIENLELDQRQATAIFRIFQEALTNVMRHAQAASVDVVSRVEGGEFVLTVRDDGRGITEEEKTGRQSLGILGMRERAYLVGAEIDISRGEGSGTVVTVRVRLSGPSSD